MRSYVFNILFYAWTTILSIAAIPLLLAPPQYCRALGRFWVRTTFALLAVVVGLRYRVIGGEHVPDGPVIFASKHQSAWDTFAFPVILPHPVYVLKRELVRIPIWGWLLNRSGVIPINRAAGGGAVREMIRSARKVIPRPIVIFPEGTRTAPGESRRYHPGVAALYRDLGIPVVPVALNSGLFWPRRSRPRRAGTITVEFLPPIPPGLDRQSFMTELKSRIEAASDRLAGDVQVTTTGN